MHSLDGIPIATMGACLLVETALIALPIRTTSLDSQESLLKPCRE